MEMAILNQLSMKQQHMKQHHTVDGKKVQVHLVKYYRIPKGTTVWLVIGAFDKTIVTERAVLYTREDIDMDLPKEYHFKLPPNDRLATKLIVKRDDVEEYERMSM